MLGYASLRGLRRWIIPVPVLSPAPLLALGPLGDARARSAWRGRSSRGCGPRCVVRDPSARWLFPHVKPVGYKAALASALEGVERGSLASTWSDALATSQGDVAPVALTQSEGIIMERRQLAVKAPEQAIFRAFSGLGGERGWLYAGWAWRLRGILDRLLGGVGLRRGRRDPDQLRVGDALDFWRVEEVQAPAPSAAPRRDEGAGAGLAAFRGAVGRQRRRAGHARPDRLLRAARPRPGLLTGTSSTPFTRSSSGNSSPASARGRRSWRGRMPSREGAAAPDPCLERRSGAAGRRLRPLLDDRGAPAARTTSRSIGPPLGRASSGGRCWSSRRCASRLSVGERPPPSLRARRHGGQRGAPSRAPGVTYHPYVEPRAWRGQGAARGARGAGLRGGDRRLSGASSCRAWSAAAAAGLPVRLEAVDGNGLLPLRARRRGRSRPRSTSAASCSVHCRRTWRRCRSPAPFRGRALSPAPPLPAERARRWPAAALALLAGAPAALGGPRPSITPCAPVPRRRRLGGGAGGAARRFVDGDSSRRYAEERNHPDADAASGLSPYLHFGHLSAHEIFARAGGGARRWSAEPARRRSAPARARVSGG